MSAIAGDCGVTSGVKVRRQHAVVDLFECQGEAYREHVLPESVKARVSVEAASALGWDRYVGRHGEIIAMRSISPLAGQLAPRSALIDIDKLLAAYFALRPDPTVPAQRERT
jgi:transketolase